MVNYQFNTLTFGFMNEHCTCISNIYGQQNVMFNIIFSLDMFIKQMSFINQNASGITLHYFSQKWRKESNLS